MDYRIFVIIIFHIVLVLKNKIVNSFLIVIDLLILLFFFGFYFRIIAISVALFANVYYFNVLKNSFKEYLIGYITVISASLYFYFYIFLLHKIPELPVRDYPADNFYFFLYLVILYPIGVIINEKLFKKIKH